MLLSRTIFESYTPCFMLHADNGQQPSSVKSRPMVSNDDDYHSLHTIQAILWHPLIFLLNNGVPAIQKPKKLNSNNHPEKRRSITLITIGVILAWIWNIHDSRTNASTFLLRFYHVLQLGGTIAKRNLLAFVHDACKTSKARNYIFI